MINCHVILGQKYLSQGKILIFFGFAVKIKKKVRVSELSEKKIVKSVLKVGH